MDSTASQETPSGRWVLFAFKQFQDAFYFIFVNEKLFIEP